MPRGIYPRTDKTRKKMSMAKIGHENSVGDKNSNWHGGISENYKGYKMIRSDKSRPGSNRKYYVREHRLIMEKHLGRSLLPTEVIHHINGDKKDNRIENLMLITSTQKHSKIHWQNKKNGYRQ